MDGWWYFFLWIVTIFSLGSRANHTSQVVLPHDVYPGYEVARFESPPNHPSRYRLLETGFSKFFTVLDNGLVMTTSDIGSLVDRPIELVVLEECANRSETHELRLHVLTRSNMLELSPDHLGEGEVPENAPMATPVDGMPLIQARGRFPVRIQLLPGPNVTDLPFGLRLTSEVRI